MLLKIYNFTVFCSYIILNQKCPIMNIKNSYSLKDLNKVNIN